jgi:polar amino acid transport system substrate-binding protein
VLIMKIRRMPALVAMPLLAVALTACGGDGGGGTTASGSQLVSDGTLTVCSDVPYPPFEDFDKGSPTGFKGFDIDIVSQIAKGLGLKIVVKDSAFDPLQSGLALNSGQCDIGASAMTITSDREKNLDFSDGYYDSKQSLLVPTGSDITSIDDLAGKKVGVQQGTTGKTYTEENAPDADIVTFPSDAEMYQAIKAGQVAALLQDLPVNVEHAKDGGFEIVQEYSTDEQYGLAIKKGNTDLVDDVNEQLKKMRDDGTYDKFYNTYFSAK